MHTIIIGSKEWCRYWEVKYLRSATDAMMREELNEYQISRIMNWLFMAYMWRDTVPWNKGK